ncbi:MAG: DEAD/DEAH box helicase, partial [Flammeovirgaceae bacterium]
MKNPNVSGGKRWFTGLHWQVFDFQQQAWDAYLAGFSGLVNAPTGSGKTYSLLVPILEESFARLDTRGVQAIWITPIRALGKEIELSATRAIKGMESGWRVGVRTGDTSTRDRERQKSNPPEFLITTPESLHVILSQKGYADFFKSLKSVVVDEWHELMGSKRGVLMELALARLKTINPSLKIWGISATIGNMEQSMRVLLGNY